MQKELARTWPVRPQLRSPYLPCPRHGRSSTSCLRPIPSAFPAPDQATPAGCSTACIPVGSLIKQFQAPHFHCDRKLPRPFLLGAQSSTFSQFDLIIGGVVQAAVATELESQSLHSKSCLSTSSIARKFSSICSSFTARAPRELQVGFWGPSHWNSVSQCRTVLDTYASIRSASLAGRRQFKTRAVLGPGEQQSSDEMASIASNSQGGFELVEDTQFGAGGSSIEPTEQLARYLEGLMPKQEIGAKRFLEKYPHADGRGVIIAIFDSGVDPGAAGLQTTPQGQPKIVDVIDCTGSGDVDTSKVVKADAGGYITGASGRKLHVNSAWKNPSGEWRAGSKRAFDLFGDSLLERVKSERKKHWNIKHHALLTDALRELAAFDQKNPKGSWADDTVKKQHEELQARVDVLQSLAQDYVDPGPILDVVVWNDGDTWRVALDTSDFHAPFMPPSTHQGIGLASSDKKHSLQTSSSTGDKPAPPETKSLGCLEDFEPMVDYSLERRHGTFSDVDLCNYAVKVYNDGGLVSLVTECSSHGTHVAGIAAAYHPEEPSLNGIAPGAQIISCKIGDTRLSSMETTTGIVRALIAAVQNKCDLINMSYGEPIALTDTGRVIELANEVVHKHGIVFVSSAGNQGPALSTVLAPGGTSSGVIGVGAYVSQSLAAFGHSVIDPSYLEEGTQYTWSSRGPAPDGALGVTVSAPGGAVAPVPTSSLQKRQLMNGTSMASPCACGGIALLLSALKADLQRSLQEGSAVHPPAWGPSVVRKAIENTALPVSSDAADPLTYGRGLLQVDKAYEYLRRSISAAPYVSSLRYVVSVTNARSGSSGRGIYLREVQDTSTPSEWQVHVSPCFDEHAGSPNTDKASFEEKVLLLASKPLPGLSPLSEGATAQQPSLPGDALGIPQGEPVSWVKAPEFVLLPHNGRSFNVRVDPTGIPPGMEYAEVCGIDLAAPWRGPLFRIPITVIRPIPASLPASTAGAVLDVPAGLGITRLPPTLPSATSAHSVHIVKIAPGHVERIFFAVPEGATWAEISLRLSSVPTPITVLSHTMQVLPHRRYTYRNARTYLKFSSPSTKSLSCVLEGGVTLELALAQMWSSGSGSPPEPFTLAQVEVEFHGLETVHGDIFLNGNSAIQRVEVAAPASLTAERLSPSISLVRLRSAHRPTESRIEPMPGPRDTLPSGRQIHSLLLTYKFSVSEPGRYTPRFPLLNQRLYDNEYEGQFYMIFDSNKMLLSQEDCYPKSVRLGKGDFVLRLFIRHDNTAYLEKLRKMPLLLDRTLDDKSTVKLSLFSSVDGALTGSDASFKSAIIFPGERKPLFLTGPADDRLPKDANPGNLLLGRATLSKLGGPGANTDSAAPARLNVTYLVPQSPKVEDKKNGGVVQETIPVEERIRDQIRDGRVKALGTAAAEKDKAVDLFQTMASELKREYPDHLPLLLEILRFWDDSKLRDKNLKKVVDAADDIVAVVDRTRLALHLAMKTDPESTSYLKERKEREGERDALVDALYRKGLALADLEEQQRKQQPASQGNGSLAARKGASPSQDSAEGTLPASEAAGPGVDEASAGSRQAPAETQEAAPAPKEERQPSLLEAEVANGSSSQGSNLAASGAFSSSVGGADSDGGRLGYSGSGMDELDTLGRTAGLQAAEAEVPPPKDSSDGNGNGGWDSSRQTASVVAASSSGSPAPSAAAAGEKGKAEKARDAFEENYAEFRRWADPSLSKHALLQVVRERRAGHRGLALKALMKMLDEDSKVTDKKLQELRVDLLQEVGWPLWSDYEKTWNLIRFPSAYPPF